MRDSSTGLLRSLSSAASKRAMLSLSRYTSCSSWYFLYAIGVSFPDAKPARSSLRIWFRAYQRVPSQRKSNVVLTPSISSTGV